MADVKKYQEGGMSFFNIATPMMGVPGPMQFQVRPQSQVRRGAQNIAQMTQAVNNFLQNKRAQEEQARRRKLEAIQDLELSLKISENIAGFEFLPGEDAEAARKITQPITDAMQAGDLDGAVKAYAGAIPNLMPYIHKRKQFEQMRQRQIDYIKVTPKKVLERASNWSEFLSGQDQFLKFDTNPDQDRVIYDDDGLIEHVFMDDGSGYMQPWDPDLLRERLDDPNADFVKGPNGQVSVRVSGDSGDRRDLLRKWGWIPSDIKNMDEIPGMHYDSEKDFLYIPIIKGSQESFWLPGHGPAPAGQQSTGYVSGTQPQGGAQAQTGQTSQGPTQISPALQRHAPGDYSTPQQQDTDTDPVNEAWQEIKGGTSPAQPAGPDIVQDDTPATTIGSIDSKIKELQKPLPGSVSDPYSPDYNPDAVTAREKEIEDLKNRRSEVEQSIKDFHETVPNIDSGYDNRIVVEREDGSSITVIRNPADPNKYKTIEEIKIVTPDPKDRQQDRTVEKEHTAEELKKYLVKNKYNYPTRGFGNNETAPPASPTEPSSAGPTTADPGASQSAVYGDLSPDLPGGYAGDDHLRQVQADIRSGKLDDPAKIQGGLGSRRVAPIPKRGDMVSILNPDSAPQITGVPPYSGGYTGPEVIISGQRTSQGVPPMPSELYENEPQSPQSPQSPSGPRNTAPSGNDVPPMPSELYENEPQPIQSRRIVPPRSQNRNPAPPMPEELYENEPQPQRSQPSETAPNRPVGTTSSELPAEFYGNEPVPIPEEEAETPTTLPKSNLSDVIETPALQDSISVRANNPTNLTDDAWGDVQGSIQPEDGDRPITIYGSVESGIASFIHKIMRALTGASSTYKADMTIKKFNETYATAKTANRNFISVVKRKMGIDINSNMTLKEVIDALEGIGGRSGVDNFKIAMAHKENDKLAPELEEKGILDSVTIDNYEQYL